MFFTCKTCPAGIDAGFFCNECLWKRQKKTRDLYYKKNRAKILIKNRIHMRKRRSRSKPKFLLQPVVKVEAERVNQGKASYADYLKPTKNR